jgi:benzoyl-CoA reductase/2-hydroxyglutaryl-CoA dehydratase subunit BcrC/BadD/HgdB
MSCDDRFEQSKKFLRIIKGEEVKQEIKKGKLLRATDQRTALTGMQLLSAYKPENIVAWRTFFVPTEIFYATGVTPFTPEMSCASMAQNQPVLRKILQRAEEQQYEPKLCSFLKSTIGGIYEGIMPKPDLVIGSPGFCSSMGSILENVSRYYNSDFFYLNIPLNYSPDASREY